MKKILSLLLILSMFAPAFGGLTPFYYKGYNSDGTAQTNPLVFRAYPPTANGFTVYGTNIIYGSGYITNTPDATGFFSNNIYANQYQVTIPNLGAQFFASIPDTASYASLALYITNAPAVATGSSGYGVITNLLGFGPATNRPGTNTIIYVSNVAGITNGSGVLTNLTVTLGTNTIYYQIR